MFINNKDAMPAFREDCCVGFEAHGRCGQFSTSYVGVDDELLDVLARDPIGYIMQGLVEIIQLLASIIARDHPPILP